MTLRTDLLAQLRPEDVMESVETHRHRYKAAPLFSQTGTGSFSSASTEERAKEVTRNTDLIQKLTLRAACSGKSNSVGK